MWASFLSSQKLASEFKDMWCKYVGLRFCPDLANIGKYVFPSYLSYLIWKSDNFSKFREEMFPRVFGVQWKAYLFTRQLAFVCVCACGHGRHFNIRNWEGKGRHRRPATRGWSWSWRIWLLHVTRFEPESGIFRRRFSVFNNLQLQSMGDFQSTVTDWRMKF